MTKTSPNLEPDLAALDDLATVRDWLRYGTSRFLSARIGLGHGATRAQDEAAYLILHTLSLPIEEIDPWLEARLTRAERMRVLEIVEKRISSRKPAAYLTREAWIGGFSFYVDERAIVPRSFIGELLVGNPEVMAPDPGAVNRILDLCTGSGCLAIIAARQFPRATVDAVDLSPDALDVARTNVRAYGLDERVRLLSGDLFQPVGETVYDLIISNPPYVTDEAVAAFPAEYRAEPHMAHAGGPDGMDIVRRILAGAPSRLSGHGSLVVEIGSGRDALQASHPDLPFQWLDTAESEGEVFALQASDFMATRKRAKPAARAAPRRKAGSEP